MTRGEQLSRAIGAMDPACAAILDTHPAPESLLESAGESDGLRALIPSLARYTASEAFGARPALTNLHAAAAYLKARYIGIQVERFSLLSLTSAGRLIEYTILQDGTLDETAFYLREVLRTVARTKADAAVLCHNHPGGTKRPSRADLDCTLNALRALKPLGVALLDHLILAGEDAVSLRADGWLDSALWDTQNGGGRLAKKWTGG